MRVNVDTKILSDIRLIVLAKALKRTRGEALGSMTLLWMYCQENRTDVLSSELIDTIVEKKNFTSIAIGSGFFESVEKNGVRVKGVRDRISEYEEKTKKQSDKGRLSAEKRWGKNNRGYPEKITAVKNDFNQKVTPYSNSNSNSNSNYKDLNSAEEETKGNIECISEEIYDKMDEIEKSEFEYPNNAKPVIKGEEIVRAGDVFLLRIKCPECNEDAMLSPQKGFKCSRCGFDEGEIIVDIKKINKRVISPSERKIRGGLSKQRVRLMLAGQGNRCAYCQEDLSNQTYDVEHILPFCVGGSNETRNLCISCKRCNVLAGGKVFTNFAKKQEWILGQIEEQKISSHVFTKATLPSKKTTSNERTEALIGIVEVAKERPYNQVAYDCWVMHYKKTYRAEPGKWTKAEWNSLKALFDKTGKRIDLLCSLIEHYFQRRDYAFTQSGHSIMKILPFFHRLWAEVQTGKKLTDAQLRHASRSEGNWEASERALERIDSGKPSMRETLDDLSKRIAEEERAYKKLANAADGVDRKELSASND